MPELPHDAIQLSIQPLQDSLPAIASKQGLVDFFSRHPVIRDAFFMRPAFPSDSAFINERFFRFTNPHIDTLLAEVHQLFPDQSMLREQLTEAFTRLVNYYPNAEVPNVKTIITGLESDLLVTDSLIVIGLDYYLGPGARYKPDLYGYLQRRYTPVFIVPSIMLLYGIDPRFNKTDLSDKTALAEMISYGKAYYFAKQMLPCVADSVFIGYTAEEIAGARQYEDLIWSRLVEDEVLFSTSHQVKQRFIGERPKTLEVGEQCPGRIGTWIGWQIVNQYMLTHPQVTLTQLMSMQNATQLFQESGYKPQLKKLPNRPKI